MLPDTHSEAVRFEVDEAVVDGVARDALFLQVFRAAWRGVETLQRSPEIIAEYHFARPCAAAAADFGP